GGDGTLLRLRDPSTGEETGRGLGLSTDGNHRWCFVDPRVGTAMVVAEAAMNVACVGARPLAVVNCLNFGNPEDPVVMWQLSEAVDGMADACRAFDAPVVGGNVSLYNETNGENIAPTPVVGLLGMHEDMREVPPGLAWSDGHDVLLLGREAAADASMGGSRWAWELRGRRDGSLPSFDLEAAVLTAAFVRGLAADPTRSSVSAAHDVGEGGLAVALAEMAIAAQMGAAIEGLDGHRALFNESPGRVVVTVEPDATAGLLAAASDAGVDARVIGRTGGSRLKLAVAVDIEVDELATAWRDELPRAVGQGTVNA
ncbi:MAG: AIR synthase related protein, partial [Actinomycetota bacterium]|nr:AIR synthase related protein [Actinomycetota bacterium]